MRCYKIQQTEEGYNVGCSIDGAAPFLSATYKEPTCFKYLVKSWREQKDSNVCISLSNIFRPQELSKIIQFAIGMTLGLFITTQPIIGCPKYINERRELIVVQQLDSFVKKDGKRYYIGEEKVVKTSATLEDFMQYKCEEGYASQKVSP